MKLIIDIPDEAYNVLLTEQVLPPHIDIEWLLIHGIPLDDVLDKIIAEIDEKSSHYEHFSSSNTANGLMIAKRIVGKYKTESEDT